MYLPLHLKRAGVITGPSSKLSRHSELSAILAWLVGHPLDFSAPFMRRAMIVGSALHYRWLKKKLGKWELTAAERLKIVGMLEALADNTIAVWLIKDAIVEVRKFTKLNGVRIGYTADAAKMLQRIGSDLKSTTARTQKEFEVRAFDYGYFRQGETYSIPLKLKEFYIVGVCKEKPHEIFIIFLQDVKWKDHIRYAKKELQFLLYFRKHYGRPKWKRKKRK